jgi:hypothetical protein
MNRRALFGMLAGAFALHGKPPEAPKGEIRCRVMASEDCAQYLAKTLNESVRNGRARLYSSHVVRPKSTTTEAEP